MSTCFSSGITAAMLIVAAPVPAADAPQKQSDKAASPCTVPGHSLLQTRRIRTTFSLFIDSLQNNRPSIPS